MAPSDPASPQFGPRLRAAMDGLPSYVPGKPPRPGAGPVYKLSSNENPYPPLPGVLEVVASAAADLNRYPDLFATELVDALARRLDVPPESIAAGTGSVGVLGSLVQTVAGHGDEVVYAWRSFESYPIVTGLSGASAVTVPLTPEARHDLPAMAAAVTERTRLVLVCTPNNPTGPAVRGDELTEFLDRVPADVMVALDEAYLEFVRDPQVPDGVELARSRPNVVVLRTFSKAYGLAGLRVGYAVADPRVADAIRKASVPFGVSTIAQHAAVASLAAERELLARVSALVAERDRVGAALRAAGWPVPDSQANFVWLPLGQASSEFAAACAQAGLAVRPFPGDGVRCTVAEPAANDLLVEVCARFGPPQ